MTVDDGSITQDDIVQYSSQEEKQFAQMRPISDFGESWTGGVVVNHYYEEDELNEHEE